ncbi:hypothetical protein Tco_1500664 [Tanacetum coccineum]
MKQENQQKIAMDEALVPIDDQVKINERNMRINPLKKQKESTYQLYLDIFKQYWFHNAFLMTADVPHIYMQQFVPNKEFAELPSHNELLSFFKQLGYKESLELVFEMHIDQMYQPWRTFLSIINRCLSWKSSGNDKPEEVVQKEKKKKAPVKKKTVAPRKKSSLTADDNILKGPDEPKKLAKLISLIEAEHQEEEHRLHDTHELIGREIPKELAEDALDHSKKNKGNKVLSKAARYMSDIKTASKASKLVYQNDEQARTNQATDGVPIVDQARSEQAGDAQANVVIPEPPVPNLSSILTMLSTGYGNQFLNVSSDTSLAGISKDTTEPEIQSIVDVHIRQEESVVQRPPLIDTVISVIPNKTTTTPTPIPPTTEAQVTFIDHSEVNEESIQVNVFNEVNLFKSSSSSTSSDLFTKYELKNMIYDNMKKSISFHTHEKHLELYNALIGSINLDEAIAKGKLDSSKVLKKRHHDDKDEDPPADFENKRKRRKRNDSEPPKEKEQSGSSPKGKTKTKPSSIDKSVNAKETVHDVAMESDQPIGVEEDVGNVADEKPQDDAVSKKDQPNWFKQDPRLETLDPDWYKELNADDAPEQSWFDELVNAEKTPTSFDDLMGSTIDFTKFVMNHLQKDKITKANLEDKKQGKEVFCISTKIKVARYDLKGIEDMIPRLWSTIEEAYDKNAELGIYHWGPKCQLFYRSQTKEIMVRRADQNLYTFKEGDFPRLHLNDIEDMLILYVQNKLQNLLSDEIVDLADELYKFSDGTLKSVHDILHDMLQNFVWSYNHAMSKRAWTDKDQQRIDKMVKKIDNLLLKRRIMRSLECFIGGRSVEMDYKLLTQTK